MSGAGVSPPRAARDLGIDAFRYLMAILVILLHLVSRRAFAEAQPGLVLPLATLARCAVPFFFISSGWFLKPAGGVDRASLLRPAARLLRLYLFWSALYIVVLAAFPLASWDPEPMQILFGGPAFHLWFLPALMIGTLAVAAGLARFGLLPTAGCAGAAAALGLAMSSYAHLIGAAGYWPRPGYLMAPAFVLAGHLLARRQVQLSPPASALMAALSFLLLLGEEAFLMRGSRAAAWGNDFCLMTFPYGMAVFLLARSLGGLSHARTVAALGRAALGIYAIHLLLVWLGLRWIDGDSLGGVLLLTALVALAATAIVLAARRVPALRPFVST